MPRPLQSFAMISAMAFLLTVTVLATVYRHVSVRELVTATEQRSIETSHMFANKLWPTLRPLLQPEAGNSGAELSALDMAVRQMVGGLPILKVKFYDLDGYTVYSSDPNQIGEQKVLNAGLLGAAQDALSSSELTGKDTFSAFSGELFDLDVVETYVPIMPDGKTPAAVIELYTDVTSISERISTTTAHIVLVTAGILAALYGLLLYVIGRTNRTLRHQYETLERSEAALRTAHEELERASEVKSIFLRTVSHELRTPLNAIIGFSEILTNRMFGPLGHEKYEEYANDINASSQHLMGIINNVLDLSSLEAGKRDLVLETIDVHEMAEECFMIMSEIATAHGVELRLQVSDELPPLSADRQATKQILLNLLSNAIKFSPENTAVTLAGTYDTIGHRFEVTDTGPGIPEVLLERITEPFTTSANETASSPGGTGLGLSIVKALVDLHGGTLEIVSARDQGTTVSVTLPSRNGA